MVLPPDFEILGNMYCSCLFFRLWRHKFWNYFYFSNQTIFLRAQKVKTNILMSWERKELLKWNKQYFFIISKQGFQLPKLSQTWDCAFKGNLHLTLCLPCYRFLSCSMNEFFIWRETSFHIHCKEEKLNPHSFTILIKLKYHETY